MVIFVYVGIKWVDYEQATRTYDVCLTKQQHSEADIDFEQAIVSIVQKELPNRPDISAQLTALIPNDLDKCGSEPTFWGHFEEIF